MWRHPPVRAVIGLVVGFVSTFLTLEAVDRYGRDDVEQIENLLGEPDFDGYCAEQLDGGTAVRISNAPQGWKCGGRTNGIWTTAGIDVQSVCEWQYGRDADYRLVYPDEPMGWRCITRV